MQRQMQDRSASYLEVGEQGGIGQRNIFDGGAASPPKGDVKPEGEGNNMKKEDRIRQYPIDPTIECDQCKYVLYMLVSSLSDDLSKAALSTAGPAMCDQMHWGESLSISISISIPISIPISTYRSVIRASTYRPNLFLSSSPFSLSSLLPSLRLLLSLLHVI